MLLRKTPAAASACAERRNSYPVGGTVLFVHIVCCISLPLGPNGEATAYRGKDATREETAAAYAGQVQFINK
jgi:hypothetical protein